MSSSDVAVRVRNLSKCFEIYNAPHDRLKQFVFPRLQRFAGKETRQYFKEFWALKDISFEINKGETVGIIGRNGSGKSTLLQIICGTLTPTRGSVETFGRVAALLELGSGFNPEFTGHENVYMYAAVLGLRDHEIDKRFGDIVNFADIGDFINQPVKTYSSGMMVRLAFAVIAHVDADILVIDEALAVGDAFFTQKCMRFLRGFMEKGTVLFVSHDTSAVISLCDKVIWLSNGGIKQYSDSKSVCESYLEEVLANNSSEKISIESEIDAVVRPQKIVRLSKMNEPYQDYRLSEVNLSTLRNDLHIFKFGNLENAYEGKCAKIVSVNLFDSNKKPLLWFTGGEKVTLKVIAEAYIKINKPIIGFSVKDRLGQTLFGDNTFLTFAKHIALTNQGESLMAEFEFYMPWLSKGDFSVQVALADGNQEVHQQLHWVHDALIIRSENDTVSTGLIGIPMLDIRLNKLGE